MKKLILFSVLVCILIPFPNVFAETLELSSTAKVYVAHQPLFVFGKALPNENLIIRLFSPDDTIASFDQITAHADGSFEYVLLTWPESSTSFPFGTYTVEVISTQQGVSKTFDVKFTSTTELVDVPVTRNINTLVYAPETAAVNQPFRVFVQTTSDGLLIGDDPKKLLETTHVHLPSGKVETLTGAFSTLHQGLYFTDYTPREEGTYVFHVVAFSQGTISHGSVATTVMSQDIRGISNQILELNSVLSDTSKELDVLKSEIEGFGGTLEDASTNIEKSTTSISSSVTNIEEASSQLNSLFFPIVASIGIIVALQIAILARRR